jgi:hypothetical protein
VKVASTVVCPGKASGFSRRKAYQGQSQSPVARSAGGRETNCLKPLDHTICGMVASFQAGAHANAQVAPTGSRPRGRACHRKGDGSMGRRRLAEAADHAGGVGSDGMGTRTRSATGAALLMPPGNRPSKGGRRTGDPGTSTDDERVAAGAVGALKRGKACGAKGPSCVRCL